MRSLFHLALIAPLLAATTLGQGLQWNVPTGGALVYERTVRRVAMLPPTTGLKAEQIVPDAQQGGGLWRYLASGPGAAPPGWEQPGFDDGSWPEGRGEFGPDVGKNPDQRTPWNTQRLLLRSQYDFSRRRPKALLLRISHDDGIRIWFNGQQVLDNRGYGRGRTYILAGKQLAPLQAGVNLVAVECENIGGIQYCDVAIAALHGLPAGVRNAEDLEGAIGRQREVSDHVQREFLGGFRPPGMLLQGELDPAGQRVRIAPGDLREIAFFVACDLERGVLGGSYQQEVPRLLRLGDVSLRGKVLPVDESGWQTMEVTVKAGGEAALRGDSKRFVQRHVLSNMGYGIEGAIQVRRRLELDGNRARVAECQCEFRARIFRGKDLKDHAADFELLETYRLADVRDGQDAPFRVAVSKAIDKGTAFLIDKLKPLNAPSLRAEGDEANRSYHSGRLALGLLALIKGGVKKDHPVLQAALAALRGRTLIDTYSLGNALMALEAYHAGSHDQADLAQGVIERQRRREIPAGDKALMQKWAELLLDNVDTRVDAEEMLRFNYVRDRRFDNSVNQYGLLGLYAAHLCGVDIPKQVWEGAIRHLITSQCEGSQPMSLDLLDYRTLQRLESNPDERRTASLLPVRPAGWSYEDPRWQGESSPAWGSMTCAGITGLAVSQAALLDLGERKNRLQNEADEARSQGFGWLAQHFTSRHHPGHINRQQHWFYYYLYGLERAALLSNVARIQGRDWYFEGAMTLIGSQNDDGSWPGELWPDQEIERAAMAVLFLKRGTSPVLTGQ